MVLRFTTLSINLSKFICTHVVLCAFMNENMNKMREKFFSYYQM